MSDVHIRTEGTIGRITLTRPKALNALTWDMLTAIDAALRDWAGNTAIALVLIDAEGEKAFCAGGDLAEMHRTGTAGDYAYGRRFWRDEYRMNARIAAYPKPVVAFLQGFTMGGGVGLAGHASHRIVGETSRIAMPECAIGLVPDVGGSALLARAPGRLGILLGLTGARMKAGDALHAGFADTYVPEADWPALKARICAEGTPLAIADAAQPPPASLLAEARPSIDSLLAQDDFASIARTLDAACDAIGHTRPDASPLSMATTLEMLNRHRHAAPSVRDALTMEYRVTHRIMQHGDFLEGIRALIVDKDRTPHWRHGPGTDPTPDARALLEPLGTEELSFEEETP